MNMTAGEIQAFLGSPVGLFIIMILASVVNGSKQIVVARQTSVTMTCWQYWSYLPETLTTLAANVLGFVVLLFTDQLNFASAIAVGYGLNSLSDLIPKGRSYALKRSVDDPAKVNPSQQPPENSK
jgi:hypothetical protein